ncbi:NAD(P)H-dependent glycerol-3-phosphate dehydrogenase [Desulfovibrio sp. SGI.169]|uniref:NAD(P)H-dependent glycerol-3-phosphate dehydrogenase n=1 Tax=Desulfovibrio sp. SGI.169 TaxID=3420561 RepID=UPI003D07BE7A
MNIAIVGGGSWGTALANTWATAGHNVIILTRRTECAQEINIHHTNNRYLPNINLNENIQATVDKREAFENAEVISLSVPAQYMAVSIHNIREYIKDGSIILCTSKGIETLNRRFMHEVVYSEFGTKSIKYAVISGPSFAPDVAAGKPAAVVIASNYKELCEKLRDSLSTNSFRIYSSTDVIGVECAGAIKTIMALAAGISDGLALGESARAGLITRGLAEMTRFGVAFGASFSTFIGLAGAGDLMVSCTAGMSRNRRVGIALAHGNSIEEALSSVDQIAEGFKTVEAVVALAKQKNIKMPIANAVYDIIKNPKDARIIADRLLSRPLTDEYII